MERDFYKNIVEKSPIGYAYHEIILDENGRPFDYRIIEINDAFETYTGLSKKDVVGRNILEIIPDINENDFNWIEYYSQVALNQTEKEFESFSSSLNSWYKVNVYSPKKGYFITLFSNTTKSKGIEKSLDESSDILKNLIEMAPVPFMLHAEDGEVIYLSDIWTKISGYSKEDIPTVNHWLDTAYDEERSKIKNIIENLYIDKDFLNNNETFIKTKSNEIRKWSFNSKYLGVLPDGRNTAMSVAIDVTERANLLSQIMADKQLLEITLLSVGDAVITTDECGIVTLVNKIAEELTGWTAKEAVGKPVEKILDIFNETSDKKSKNIVTRVLETSKIQELEKNSMIRSRDGNERPIEDSAAPIIDENGLLQGAVLVFRDLSDIEKANKVLQYERDKAKMYLDVMAMILVVLDKDGNISLINNAGCKLLNDKEENLIGKNWFENYIPEEKIDEIKAVFNRVISNKVDFPRTYENVLSLDNGEERLMKWNNSVLLDINSEAIGLLSFGEDITKIKKYEDNLIRLGYYDSLTGVSNRRFYEENLEKIDIEDNYPLTIVMADINGLKLVNDAFGHQAGDELLIAAADAILDCCREEDVLSRIGGDEFVVIMPNSDEKTAEKLIDDVHNKIKKTSIEGIELSISFGYKTKSDQFEDIQETYRSAEDSMYREKLLEIPSMRSGAIDTIVAALYEKDKNSEIHSRTVSALSEKLAIACGMKRLDVAEVKTAGLLHDIGKIIIPSDIINKVGSLSKTEYNIIKGHSEIGFRILNSTSDMRSISNIVLNHHERWDGKGYPRNIKGLDIPLKSRIISITDAFDAMTSKRTYQKIRSKEAALEEIIRNSGSQFDPEIVEIFKNSFQDITK